MMAAYFHGGSEIQAAAGGGGDQNLQTLYLMNPNFIAATYSDAQITPNMLYLNPSNALSQGNLPHAPPPPPPPAPSHQQQFIGIPLSGSHPSEDHGRPSPSSSSSLQHQIPAPNLHGLSSVSRVHPNLWSPANHPIRPSHSQPGPITASGPDMGDPMGFRRPTAAQGLSLSLSPGMQMQPNQSQVPVTLGGGPSPNGLIPGSKYLKAAQQLLEEVVNVGDNFNGTDFINNDKPGGGNSKNEVGDDRTRDSSGTHKEKAKATTRDQSGVGEGLSHGGDISVGGDSSSGGSLKAAELSTAQRQELQMKKAKLLSMLDEVEQRYRQYDTQMQVVVSSFEQAAGSGSAKLYTSLALKTISKQFRCLKDAILCQIKGTSKSLGEEGSNGNNAYAGVKLEGQGGAGSRLRFVDHQLRQQRALQQLGMMQPNAWRPQRGLPERAVSVLRAWLFEHFLHPYPKDSDKLMLAKQTGLTRSQVSNWFINARVRLWKPMVEEMYTEEMKTTQEQKSGNNSEDNTTTTTTNTWSANNNSISSKNEITQLTTKETGRVGQQDHGIIVQAQQQQQQQQAEQTTSDMISNMCATSSQGFTLIGASSAMESLMGRSPKKQRSNSDMQNNSPSSILSMDMEMKAVDPHQQRHSFLMATNNHGEAADADVGPGFNPYMVNDMAGRFNPDQMTTYNGNAVSLTLGLPHCDNLSLENPHQNFLPNQGIPLGRRLDIGAGGDPDFCGNNMPQPSHPTNAAYETLDLQNRKRFAAQILHDFVASQ